MKDIDYKDLLERLLINFYICRDTIDGNESIEWGLDEDFGICDDDLEKELMPILKKLKDKTE